ncbi:MAG: DNA ligase D [Elusimicrobia bacterium]|nr:DNA ligase D [Elusimicrobiota bacterium]
MRPLAEYRRKRRFDRTPEPRPRALRTTRTGLSFTIQRHAARRLHYDFRLELDGVLLSWAVPKGPSFDPREKRLAVHVEDHPVEYGSFEGVIPKGEYGGGTVVLWDRGTWTPDGDPRESYRRGRLKFTLDGEKLSGKWALVRMGGRAGEGGKNWLLIKEKDGEARPLAEFDVTTARPESVSRGRGGAPRVWRSKRPSGGRSPRRGSPASIEGAERAGLPERVSPQLCTLVDRAPGGEGWLHEVKLDGYRLLARISRGEIRLFTRKWNDWTPEFPKVVESLASLPCAEAILDGEVVALDEKGVSRFQLLQNALGTGRPLYYYAFDLLHLDGVDLRRAPLAARKEALKRLMASAPARGNLRYSDHVAGEGPEFHKQACARGLEGVVSKRADSVYSGERGATWLKAKCLLQQEFVVAGWTDPQGGRRGFGALILGYRERGKLRYAGRVGAGFSDKSLAELAAKLEGLSRKSSPFPEPVPERCAHWVEPELVAEVAFTGWTGGRVLRHPAFQGLREDKPAREVTRELALTNPDKVLYPETGLTKRGLAEYYDAAAKWMLPHVARRPLTLVRCPSGRGGNCFYQKHLTSGSDPALKPVDIEEGGGTQTYFYLEDVQGLRAAVQLGALELHPWLCRVDDLEHPDMLVLDLDPAPDVSFGAVVEAALDLKERLEELGQAVFAKTTGGKGLHLVCPLVPEASFDEVKAFVKLAAEDAVKREPLRFIATASKSARGGRIFLDYLRNGRGALAVAPYSTRARRGAPVAVPLHWDEVRAGLDPAEFTVGTVPRRLRLQRRDPWATFESQARSLPPAWRRRWAAMGR